VERTERFEVVFIDPPKELNRTRKTQAVIGLSAFLSKIDRKREVNTRKLEKSWIFKKVVDKER
jgi:dimeric dUTPase (all-alpha-NTP-PPase superfamily)